jgi:hypothetical protein
MMDNVQNNNQTYENSYIQRKDMGLSHYIMKNCWQHGLIGVTVKGKAVKGATVVHANRQMGRSHIRF